MIYTYRFVKKKANERKQRQAAAAPQTNDDAPVAATSPQRQDAQESASTVQETSGEEAPKDHSTLKWNLMLLAALALPVFFETVDYTGQSHPNILKVLLLIFRYSCRHRSGSHRVAI